jgi:uncharacterized phage protein (TIGR01671 family)
VFGTPKLHDDAMMFKWVRIPARLKFKIDKPYTSDMEREIKFRYFHKTTKNMFWHNLKMGNKQMLGGGWITAFPMDVTDPMTVKDALLLDPIDIEFMQFTGVLDKNGREIYEGDIIRYGLPDFDPEGEPDICIEAVVFQDGCFNVDGHVPVGVTTDWNCEVIGNVFENPGLLPS